MRQIKITGTPPGCLVEIDGQAAVVMALDLHLDAQSLPQLTIQPDVYDVDIYIEGDVQLDEQTVRMLMALGWTPPTVPPAEDAVIT